MGMMRTLMNMLTYACVMDHVHKQQVIYMDHMHGTKFMKMGD